MIKISGSAIAKVDRGDAKYAELLAIHKRLASKDSTIWGAEAQAEVGAESVDRSSKG